MLSEQFSCVFQAKESRFRAKCGCTNNTFPSSMMSDHKDVRRTNLRICDTYPNMPCSVT